MSSSTTHAELAHCDLGVVVEELFDQWARQLGSNHPDTLKAVINLGQTMILFIGNAVFLVRAVLSDCNGGDGAVGINYLLGRYSRSIEAAASFRRV
jgi:hypothetical protein